jgi:hypothetical protein
MDRTFTNADDVALCALIAKARERLVFVGPGIRPVVAEALTKAMELVPRERIHLVLDVDPEVCRLGYGDKDFKGMERLQEAAAKHGLQVNHHPGIRIGLVIADDATLIYSPTPELIEAGSRQPEKPNAILLQNAVPPQLATACGAGPNGPVAPEVGSKPIDTRMVEQAKTELRERPPKEFNVARMERMFNSMLHYVELSIEDYKLASRTLQLDAKLFGVQNEDVINRLTNKYRLFAESDTLTVEIPVFGVDGQPDGDRKRMFNAKDIDRERSRIKKKFIIEAGKYGLLILRRNVKDFEHELESLRVQIAAYRTAVQDQLKEKLHVIVNELLNALCERLLAQPPDHWRSRFLGKAPTKADIERLFMEDVQREVDRVRMDFKPKVFTAYKDVTYRTFKDEEFRAILEKRFGKEAIAGIFREYDVAPDNEAVRQKR